MSDSYFGCFTGDCPHQKQAECDEAIKRYCAELEQELTDANSQLNGANILVTGYEQERDALRLELAELRTYKLGFQSADEEAIRLERENQRLKAELAKANETIDDIREGGRQSLAIIESRNVENQQLRDALIKAHNAYYLSSKPFIGDIMRDIVDDILRKQGHDSPYL